MTSLFGRSHRSDDPLLTLGGNVDNKRLLVTAIVIGVLRLLAMVQSSR
jgi:hypothetical protein